MQRMDTAQTILQQLGGARFVAMTGARQFVSTGTGLQFGLPRGAVNRANKVVIDLDPSDTYRVRFFSIRGVNVREISDHTTVYADGLARLFREQTGLEVRL